MENQNKIVESILAKEKAKGATKPKDIKPTQGMSIAERIVAKEQGTQQQLADLATSMSANAEAMQGALAHRDYEKTKANTAKMLDESTLGAKAYASSEDVQREQVQTFMDKKAEEARARGLKDYLDNTIGAWSADRVSSIVGGLTDADTERIKRGAERVSQLKKEGETPETPEVSVPRAKVDVQLPKSITEANVQMDAERTKGVNKISFSGLADRSKKEASKVVKDYLAENPHMEANAEMLEAYVANNIYNDTFKWKLENDEQFFADAYEATTGKSYAEYKREVDNEAREKLQSMKRELEAMNETLKKKRDENRTNVGQSRSAFSAAWSDLKNAFGGNIEEIENLIDGIDNVLEGSFSSGFDKGFDFDRMATVGLSGVFTEGEMANALMKANNGEPLTEEEENYVRIHQYAQELDQLKKVREKYAEQMYDKFLGFNLNSIGEGVGTTVEMMPAFAGGMTATGMIGKFADIGGKAALKSALNAGGKELFKYGVKTTGKLGYNYGLAKVRGLAAAPFMPSTYNTYLESLNSAYSFDDNGNLTYKPVDKTQSYFGAVFSTANEISSEYLGIGIGKVVGWGARGVGRMAANTKIAETLVDAGKKARKYLPKLTPEAKVAMRTLGVQADPISETLSEALGDIMTSYEQSMIGMDVDMSQYGTFDYWMTLAGVTLAYGGSIAAMGAVKSYADVRSAVKERDAILGKISNRNLYNTLLAVSTSDDVVLASSALADFDWDGNGIKPKDEDRRLAEAYVAADLNVKIMEGAVEEGSRLDKFRGTIEGVRNIVYQGKAGEYSESIFEAEVDGKKVFVVNGFEKDSTTNLYVVVDAATGEKSSVDKSKVKLAREVDVDTYIQEAYTNAFSLESEKSRVKDVREKALQMDNPTEKDVQRVASTLNIALPKVGDAVMLANGNMGSVTERLSPTEYAVQDLSGATYKVHFTDILSTDKLTATAQGVLARGEVSAPMPTTPEVSVAEASAEDVTPDVTKPATDENGITMGSEVTVDGRVGMVRARTENGDYVVSFEDESGNYENAEVEVYTPTEMASLMGVAPMPTATTESTAEGTPTTTEVATTEDGSVDIEQMSAEDAAKVLVERAGTIEEAIAQVKQVIETVTEERKKMAKAEKKASLNDIGKKSVELQALDARLEFYGEVLGVLEGMLAEQQKQTMTEAQNIAEEAGVATTTTEKTTNKGNEKSAETPTSGLIRNGAEMKFTDNVIRMVDFIAQRLGITVEFVDGLKNEAGQPINGDIKGKHVRISTKGDRGVKFIVGHEFFHRIKDNVDEATYNKYIGALKEFFGEERWENALNAQKSKYRAHNVAVAKKSMEGMTPEEVAAIAQQLGVNIEGLSAEDAKNAVARAAMRKAEQGDEVARTLFPTMLTYSDELMLEETAADISGEMVANLDAFSNFVEDNKSEYAIIRGMHKALRYINDMFAAFGQTTRQRKVKRLIKNLENIMAEAVKNERKGAKKAREEAKKKANTPTDDTVVTNNKGDVEAVTNEQTGQGKFSLSTYREGGREALADFLDARVAENALTPKEAADMMQQMDDIYEACTTMADKYEPFGQWSEAKVVEDKDGNPVFSVIKANGDYAMNLDFSLVCKKRRTLDAVLNNMVKRGMIKSVSQKDTTVAKINEVIRKYGFETACALCFVDARRFQVIKTARQFCDLYNDMVDLLIPKKSNIAVNEFNFANRADVVVAENGLETMSDDALNIEAVRKIGYKVEGKKKDGSDKYGMSVMAKIARHLVEHPEDRKHLSPSDFISTAGFDRVKEQKPAILSLYNAKKGTGGPKAAFSDVQYLNDIIRSNWKVDEAYAVGGVRLQSFSDYVPRMVFDYIQMVAELAAKKLPVHAYTKEALFAKTFGLTGMKINLSLVPDVVEGGVAAGLDAEGNYVWKQGETFPYEEAIALQNAEGYRDNCGTIAVGVSDAHILKMLDDDNIRMVIPYHKSGLPKQVAKMNNVAAFTDYTNVQNTTKDGKAITKEEAKEVPNYNELLREHKDARKAAQAYVDWCTERGYTPKFAKFANHTNYYKLLEDFTTMVDGKYAPQEAVTFTFPTEESAFGSLESLIEQGLEEDAVLEGQRDVKVDAIVEEVGEVLGVQPKYSLQVSVEELAEIEAERQSIIETAKANGTYLKAPNGKDTKLTPEQWVNVRTSRFKKWFGDWEKAARIEKLRSSESVVVPEDVNVGKYELNRESAEAYLLNELRGEYTIVDTNEKVTITRKGAKKVTSHSADNVVHLKSIAAIPQMLENAIFIEESAAEKGNAKYDTYRYYVCGLRVGNNDYTVRITIGVKSGKYYYDHSLTSIEKGNLIEIAQGFTPNGGLTLPSYAESKDKRIIPILQTNSSKIVDENGEPKVVWHGGQFGISSFVPLKNMHFGTKRAALERIIDREVGHDDVKVIQNSDGSYSWEYSDPYEESEDVVSQQTFETETDAYENAVGVLVKDVVVKPYFLNIRNIASMGDAGFDWAYTIEKARKGGYEGIVYNNLYEDKGADSYIAFNPNQIKSADPVTYDDNGNIIPLSERFNPRKEDIRYSLIGEIGAANIEDYGRYGSPMFNLEMARELEAMGKSAKDIRLATNWERGVDGKWRYEIMDGKYSHPKDDDITKKRYRLADVLDNADLYKAYPYLKDIEVEYDPNFDMNGAYYGDLIKLKSTRSLEQINSTLIHEVQHAIQAIEMFAYGGNTEQFTDEPYAKQLEDEMDSLIDEFWNTSKFRISRLAKLYYQAKKKYNKIQSINEKAFEAYRRLAGETEARNVQKRMGMSEDERLNTMLEATEDVARKDQGVLFREVGVGADAQEVTRFMLPDPDPSEVFYDEIPIFDEQGNEIDITTLSSEEAKAILDSKVRQMLEAEYEHNISAIRKEAREARQAIIDRYNEGKNKRKKNNKPSRTNAARIDDILGDKPFESLPYEDQALILIATGQAKIRWSDKGAQRGLASELGLKGSKGDKHAYRSIWSGATKSFNEVVHDWWESIGGQERGIDDQDLRNALIEALQSVQNAKDAMGEIIRKYDDLSAERDAALAEVDRMEDKDLHEAKAAYEQHYANFELSEGEERASYHDRAAQFFANQNLSRTDEILSDLTNELERQKRKIERLKAENKDIYAPLAEGIQKSKDIVLRALERLRMFAGMEEVDLNDVARLINLVKTARSQSQVENLGAQATALVQRISIKKAKANLYRLLSLKLSNTDIIHKMLTESDKWTKEERDAILKHLWKVSRNGLRVSKAVHRDTKEIFDELKRLVDEFRKEKLKGLDNEQKASAIDAKLAELEQELHPEVVYDSEGNVQDNSNLPTDFNAENKHLAKYLFKSHLEMLAAEAKYRNASKVLSEKKENKEQTGDAYADVVATREDYLHALTQLNSTLEHLILKGKDELRDWNAQKEKHEIEIRRMGIEAIGGEKADSQGKRSKWGARQRARLNISVNAPYWTFETVLEKIDHKTPYKRGKFYTYFMDKWSDANDDLIMRYMAHFEELGEAMSKCFPNDATFMKMKRNPYRMFQYIMRKAESTPIGTITYKEGDSERQMVLNIANAMYIIAMWRQPRYQEAMKERGITQKDVDTLMQSIASKDAGFIDFMDWVNEKFLPSTRLEYDVVFRKMNGGSMPKEVNYFPARVAAHQEVDLANIENGAMPTTPTALKDRTSHNIMPEMGMDYFKVLEAHIEDMDKWVAYAELTADLNVLLSSDEFRRRLNEYMGGLGGDGGGKGSLYELFKQTSLIATGLYRGDAGMQAYLGKVQKAWATSNIAFRGWTALKQISSVTTGMFDNLRFYKHALKAASIGGIYWEIKDAMAISPSLRQRWKSGAAGMEALAREAQRADGYTVHRGAYEKSMDAVGDAIKWLVRKGMTPNAAVDLLSCSIIVNSVYETEIARLTGGKREATEEEKRAAVRKAERAFNTTQQSSEGAYLAPVQANPAFGVLTTYMNASFALHRKRMAGVKELWKLMTSKEYRRFIKDEYGVDAAKMSAVDAMKDIMSGIAGELSFAAMGWGLMEFMSWVNSWFNDDDDDDDTAAAKAEFADTWWQSFLNGYLLGSVATSIKQGFDASLTPAYDELFSDVKGIFDDKGDARWEVAQVAFKYFLGIDLQSLYKAGVGFRNLFEDDERVGAILMLLNAPERYVKAFVGDRREGETMEEYQTRIVRFYTLFDDVKYSDYFDEDGKYIGEDAPSIIMSKTKAQALRKEYEVAYRKDILHHYGGKEAYASYMDTEKKYKDICELLGWEAETKPSKEKSKLSDLHKELAYEQKQVAKKAEKRKNWVGSEEGYYDKLMDEQKAKDELINQYYEYIKQSGLGAY